MESESNRERVLILQRVIPEYRVRVFKQLTNSSDYDISVVMGADSHLFKAKNAKNLEGIKHVKLSSRVFSIFGRVLTWHEGLLGVLRRKSPAHIICEAESHFLGYMTAIFYKCLFNRKVRLYMWCFYAIPGRIERTIFHALLKQFTRSFFDGFISYSSFGKEFLEKKGVPSSRISVATNVCDTHKFLAQSDRLSITKMEAKRRIGNAGHFVISYVGTLDPAKRPDLLIDLAAKYKHENVAFRMIGSGPMETRLRAKAASLGLKNLAIDGKVTSGLDVFYRASDAIIIPGRGGIVISEAMCFARPVIVYQADGVEFDLVENGVSGFQVLSPSIEDFAAAIDKMRADLPALELMGNTAQRKVQDTFTTSNMATGVLQILESRSSPRLSNAG